jgi:hypothetical protein
MNEAYPRNINGSVTAAGLMALVAALVAPAALVARFRFGC